MIQVLRKTTAKRRKVAELLRLRNATWQESIDDWQITMKVTQGHFSRLLFDR